MTTDPAKNEWLPPGKLSRVNWACLVMGLNDELKRVCTQLLLAKNAGLETVLLERREAIVAGRLRQLLQSRDNEL